MLTILANISYVLVAVAMIVLILLQRGAGAAAGSGFGGGASSTVFGARGSANFMSRSTAVLAGLFFLLSLGMAIFHAKPGVQRNAQDIGIMGGAEVPQPTAPAATDVPAATPTVDPTPTTPAVQSNADMPSAVPVEAGKQETAPESVKEPEKK